MLSHTAGHRAPEIGSGEVASVRYISGTTGSPKGVLLTHRNLVNNAWSIDEWLRPANRPLLSAVTPLSLCRVRLLFAGTLIRGAALILPSTQFDAGAALQAISSERCTILGSVRTMLMAMLEHPEFESFDLGSLRLLWTGGSPCPVAFLRRVMEHMHVPRLFVLYGHTKASPLITMAHPDDFYSSVHQYHRTLDSKL